MSEYDFDPDNDWDFYSYFGGGGVGGCLDGNNVCNKSVLTLYLQLKCHTMFYATINVCYKCGHIMFGWVSHFVSFMQLMIFATKLSQQYVT